MNSQSFQTKHRIVFHVSELEWVGMGENWTNLRVFQYFSIYLFFYSRCDKNWWSEISCGIRKRWHFRNSCYSQKSMANITHWILRRPFGFRINCCVKQMLPNSYWINDWKIKLKKKFILFKSNYFSKKSSKILIGTDSNINSSHDFNINPCIYKRPNPRKFRKILKS